jgi:hypothetical protein
MIGTKLAHYEITGHLGTGGMGEVYQATDSKLGRRVAIKLLPEAFTHDTERASRFEHEARVLASLNHPNIATIHGIEEFGGRKFLVMELVPGETLAERIKRAPLPLDEALPIARQIAEGLEAAHAKGIVHRDLKPANIKITEQGQVKLLDFGLAKAFARDAAEVNLSNSPTLSVAATNAGVILGTASYMSPEQAKGKETDRTTDVWAFGCVLYEILTGRTAFEGETLGEILGSVFKAEPDWSPLPVGTPAAVQRVLRRALKKDPRQRLGDIRDARIEIEEAGTEAEAPVAAVSSRGARLAWIAFAAAFLAAIAGWLRPTPMPAGATAADLAFTIVPVAGELAPVGDLFATPEISPDGSAIIFYGVNALGRNGGVQLRYLNKLTPDPVRTGSFRNPGFWSPDSRSFVFSDGSSLKKMRVPDGAPEIVANDVAVTLGGSWSDKGTLLFAAVKTRVDLYAVPAVGGVAKRIEVTGLPEGNRTWPEFLPGSEDFLFFTLKTTRGIEESEIYLATLRDGRAEDPVLLMKNATVARYTPAGGGRILFVRNDNLYSQRLNQTARKLEGEPELVQQNVASSPAFGRAHFSVSRTGVVAWRPGTAGLSQVTIFDRQGKEIGTTGSPTIVQTLKLAPDETRLLLGFDYTAWLLEPGQPGQLQLEQGSRETLFSPDGSKFIDAVLPEGGILRVIERPVTGEGAVRELARPPGLGRLEDISPDGKALLFSRGAMDTTVFSFRLDGVQTQPKSLIQSGETISHARFSPDGRWIVYTASERGSGAGIYVQSYPGPALRQQVTSRGNYPVWRKDGREIVYLDEHQGKNYIWSVPVAAPGAEFHAGIPSPLFPARLPATTFGDLNFLAVSHDGSRFYIPQAVEQPDSGVIHVKIGWIKQ